MPLVGQIKSKVLRTVPDPRRGEEEYEGGWQNMARTCAKKVNSKGRLG